jgi:hypothetical protein
MRRYFVVAVLWSLMVLYGVRKMKRHHETNGRYLTDAQCSLVAQADAIVVTLLWVFSIQLLIHAVYQFGRPDLIWRPPPLESLEQRYNEIGNGDMRFREYQHVRDEYEGQCEQSCAT